MAELKKITNQPVKYVINTHHHGDHTGGNAKMLAMNAEITRRVSPAEYGGRQPTRSAAIAVDRYAEFTWAARKFRCIIRPRPHNGDIVILFPAQRVLAAGDMFISAMPLLS